MSDINPESLRGLESSSTCRGACNPPHWSESRSITNADNTRFPPDGRDLHPQPLSGKKSNSINILEKWGARDITIKREGERDGNYTAVHSGKLPSCQACLDARTRPRFTADLPPKLLMPNISRFPICLCWSLSLSLLSHMLALPDSQPPLQIWFHSLSLSLSGVVMVTTFWYYRPSVLEEELEFDTEIPSQCPLPKPGARMHAGRMFLQKNPQTCWIFTFSLCSIFPLLTFSLFCCLVAFTPLRYRVRSGASWLAC